MNGKDLAQQVSEEFGTRRIRRIAAQVGLSIRFGSWHPVTAGEFDPVAKEITINERADLDSGGIIAHELAHYFLLRNAIQCDDIEKFCDEFAAEFSARNDLEWTFNKANFSSV